MSNSEKLRKTHTEFRGGQHIFNSEALKHELNLKETVLFLKEELERMYPHFMFTWKQKLMKIEIAKKININTSYTSQSKSFVKPDGGILSVIINEKEYPILISEAKKQGTNTDRITEGLKKQPKGNAIERVFKNIEEFRLYCSDIDYFPYVIFACGCDFENGSSILDRLDAMTKYEPRNVNYTLDTDQKVTIFVRDKYFTCEEIYSKIKDITINIMENLNDQR